MKKEKLKKIASNKQIDMIKYIKNVCDVKFSGKTSQDVYNFIGEWYPKAIKMQQIKDSIGEIGVTTYRATKKYHGNDVHGTWEETINLKNTIAHELFKGEIIRGRDPIDALCDFQRRAMLETMFNENYDDDYDLDR